MNFVFRCDGSDRIGMGHVVRSGSLAQSLRANGHRATFVMRTEEAKGAAAVAADNFELELLPPGASLDLQAGVCCDIARRSHAAAIVADSYELDDDFLRACATAAPLCVIDDFARYDLRCADVVVNQNLGSDRLSYRTARGAVLLFGPAYALLRPEFAAARDRRQRTFASDDARVLVMLGGGDVEGKLERIIGAFEGRGRALELRAVGLSGDRLQGQHRVTCLPYISDVPQIMAWADVSISAGGTTCWELACMATPMVLTMIADNQVGVVEGLAAAGAAVSCGWFPASLERLAPTVEMLLKDPGRRRELSRGAAQLADGRGAERVTAVLQSLGASARFRS